MTLDRKLFLVGYRGTGKTTVARELAELLGSDWVDADDQIELRGHRTIAEIFAEDGEQGFRDIEEEVVSSLAAGPNQVVALGGGAVLRESNRAAIAGHHVVWLVASPKVLAGRLTADETSASRRPSLTGAGLVEEIEQVLAVRTPIYQQCATMVVSTEGRSPREIAAEIHGMLAGN
ncbi:shikimate kinase [Aeoliella sp. SH292]|uniref:shikimate kinase n=1 Tax=Aeoliella sp. SH292 TaxID=3454464 RepID=UPI003F9A3C4B